jgi:hypothetical protein
VDRHGHHPGQGEDLGADPAIQRPLSSELAEGAGQGANGLGFEQHLEELEARHPIHVVARQGNVKGPQQSVVERRHTVCELRRGCGEDGLLVQGQGLAAVLHGVRADLGQRGRVAFGVPGNTVLCERWIEGLNRVGPVQEWLGEQDVRAAQIQAEALELQVGHGRAHRRHQPDGVGVVEEARLAQLDGVAMGAALSSRLEDPHREAGFGEIGGGGEAVDASPDDDDVVVLQFSPLGATPARR